MDGWMSGWMEHACAPAARAFRARGAHTHRRRKERLRLGCALRAPRLLAPPHWGPAARAAAATGAGFVCATQHSMYIVRTPKTNTQNVASALARDARAGARLIQPRWAQRSPHVRAAATARAPFRRRRGHGRRVDGRRGCAGARAAGCSRRCSSASGSASGSASIICRCVGRGARCARARRAVDCRLGDDHGARRAQAAGGRARRVSCGAEGVYPSAGAWRGVAAKRARARGHALRSPRSLAAR
jgi:hypothetical protein